MAGAIAQFSKALEIQPDDAEIHYNLGVALFVKGDLEEAIAQYQTALAIAPDNAVFHNNLGTALYAKGAVDEAIAQFQESSKLQPGYADAHYNLGNALLRLGKLDEAIAQYRRTLEINPGHEEAHYNLGVALFLKGNLAEAIAQYQKVLEINPGQVNAQNNLAWLLSTAPDASLRNGVKSHCAGRKCQPLERGRKSDHPANPGGGLCGKWKLRAGGCDGTAGPGTGGDTKERRAGRDLAKGNRTLRGEHAGAGCDSVTKNPKSL